MWAHISRFILRYKLFLLISLLFSTIFMANKAMQVKYSYEFLPLLPEDDPIYIEYQEFLGVDIDVLDSMFDVDSDEVYDMFNIKEDDSIDSTKVILETIDGIFFPVERSSLNFIASQISLSNLETQLMGNDGWLDMDLLKEEAIYPHISDMIFVTSYSPKYKVGNSFDYDPVLNNAFHFGLDFSNFLINSKSVNGKFILNNLADFRGYTREFDFSQSQSNISPKIVKFSNKRIYNTDQE